MREYIGRFNLSPESLRKAIREHSERYTKVEKFYNDISQFEREYLEEMNRYKNVLPNAMFPPTYLIVGDYLGYANGSKFGQLVTIEKTIDNTEPLKNVIVHELTHFQQAVSLGIDKYSGVYTKKDNMLDLILREGGAEFITYNLVRQNVDQFKKLKLYEEKEAENWEKFKIDIKIQDKTIWLMAPSNDADKERPWFLGYSLGYKIVEAYYHQSENKDEAIEDILKIENANEFLKKSKYASKH